MFVKSVQSNKTEREVQLEQNVKSLQKDLANFVHGQENLNAILGAQRSSLSKQGLGYKPISEHSLKTQKNFKPKYASPFIKCMICKRKGHFMNNCRSYIPFNNHTCDSSVNTNTKGPKVKWVPKKVNPKLFDAGVFEGSSGLK